MKSKSKLEAENKKLRECVEMYANENNWYKDYFVAITENLQHGYKRAQKCLEELEAGDE